MLTKANNTERDAAAVSADTAPGSSAGERHVKKLVGFLKMLADETRLRILFLLYEREEMNVLELCGDLGQRQPSVSHHLALLRDTGLVAMCREGKHNYYRLIPGRFEELLVASFDGEADNGGPLRFANFELRYAPTNATR